MKALVLALVGLSSFVVVGCDEEAPPGRSSRRVAAPVADARGRWEMDVDAFVNENWTLLAQGPRKLVAPIVEERERIATLRVGERAGAERALQAKLDALPADQRAVVDAALGTPEQMKAWVRSNVTARMVPSSVALEFHAGGRCTFLLAIPSQERQEAEGTWSQERDRVTVRLTNANGKAAKGKDLQAVTMTVRGDRLVFRLKTGQPTLIARRAS